MELTEDQERALVEALRPLFRLYSSYPRDRDIGYQGPVEALTLYPVLIGQKPNGDALVADPAALLDGEPSLCWREWARVDADEVAAQRSSGPRRGGIKLVDILDVVASRGGFGPGRGLLDILRKVSDPR